MCEIGLAIASDVVYDEGLTCTFVDTSNNVLTSKNHAVVAVTVRSSTFTHMLDTLEKYSLKYRLMWSGMEQHCGAPAARNSGCGRQRMPSRCRWSNSRRMHLLL
eukprot:Platyproteum_vivax@DN7629_c0_g1_i5.p1